jgi:hypothetical protein
MHGLSLEAKVKAQVLSLPKVKALALDKKQLLLSLPQAWRQKCLLHLQKEGYCHWGQVPVDTILDRCFGIDLLIVYRGYILGLDITSNWQEVSKKSIRFQARHESNFFSVFSPDSTAVWYLTDPTDLSPAWLDAMCKEQRHGSIFYAHLEHNSCVA